MHTNREARWAVRRFGLPTVVRPCPDCPSTRHRPSGRIRVNASGKLLDVWLLLSCAGCDRTSKVPVHERAHVSSLDPARLVAYENNDPAVVAELTMNASLAAKHGYRLDWARTWELDTRMPLYALDDPHAFEIRVHFDLPAPIRAERLLCLGLGLSRGEVRRLVDGGRIHLPVPLEAKVHRDFTFTLHGPGAVDAARHPAAAAELPLPLPRSARYSSGASPSVGRAACSGGARGSAPM